MRNLIPAFIHDQYLHQHRGGRLQAAAMFVDISGFTQLTTALMRGGDEGAEILSAILNRVFAPTIAAIGAHGGFVATFAGDAFTALFPDEAGSPLRALECAARVRALLGEVETQQTRLGDFVLRARLGLAYGAVEWGLLGQDELTYFFCGPAIDACAQAEHRAGLGEIVLDPVLAGLVPRADMKMEVMEDGYGRLSAVALEASTPAAAPHPALERDVVARFYPAEVLDLHEQGEFRNVAPVFFSFAGLDTAAELDAFLSTLLAQARLFGGYFNKVDFGDKGGVALVLVGAPTAYENNVERALDMCLAVRRELAGREDLPHLHWRAGVTYGLVYAGLIGAEERGEYTALGEVVNLSARLMMQAGWGEVWVGEAARRAGRQHEYGWVGMLALKGQAGPTTVYRLLGKQAMERVFQGPLIGREEELARARVCLAPLAEGRPGGALYIYGEAGVGKSRLVYALREAGEQFHWLSLPCDGTLHSSFAPFAYFFQHFFDQATSSEPEEKRIRFAAAYDRLLATIDEVVPTLVGEAETARTPFPPGEEIGRLRRELVRLRPILAGFLGLHEAGSLYEQLEPRLRYENTLAAFQQVFKALSLEKPLVLEVEDVQWIDPDSTQALQEMAPELASWPILLVAAGRYREDGSKPRLNWTEPTAEIDLGALSEAGVRKLTASLLGGEPGPRLLARLSSQAQGNPFFVEQTVRYLQETGRLAATPAWEVAGDEADIPATLNDLLIARLDRLSEEMQEVVQTASVLGREFQVQLLSQVLRRSEQSLAGDLPVYLEQGTTGRLWSLLSKLEYAFTHALLQDAAYRMQLHQRLRQLHRWVAEAIEELRPGDRRAYADLAFHYERAEVEARAIVYGHQAADFAHETYAVEAATAGYRRTLALLDRAGPEAVQEVGLRRRIELYAGLAEMLRWQAQYEEAIRACEQMRTAAEVAGDVAGQVRAWLELSIVQDGQGHYRESLAGAEQAWELARPMEGSTELVDALCQRGWALVRLGELEAALVQAQEALAVSRELGYKAGMANSLNTLGGAYYNLGRTEPAQRCYEEALDLFRQLGNREREERLLSNLGVTAMQRGEGEAAIALYQQALAISREIGNRHGEMIRLSNLGGVRAELGHYQEAEADLRQVVEWVEQSGAKFPEVYCNLVQALVGQGKGEEALEVARRVLVITREMGPIEQAFAWHALGQATGELGRPVQVDEESYDAPACFARSRQTFQETGLEGHCALVLREWARHELRRGDREKGRQLWQQARQVFEQLGMQAEVARMDEQG